jgi:hypothetical protein
MIIWLASYPNSDFLELIDETNRSKIENAFKKEMQDLSYL